MIRILARWLASETTSETGNRAKLTLNQFEDRNAASRLMVNDPLLPSGGQSTSSAAVTVGSELPPVPADPTTGPTVIDPALQPDPTPADPTPTDPTQAPTDPFTPIGLLPVFGDPTDIPISIPVDPLTPPVSPDPLPTPTPSPGGELPSQPPSSGGQPSTPSEPTPVPDPAPTPIIGQPPIPNPTPVPEPTPTPDPVFGTPSPGPMPTPDPIPTPVPISTPTPISTDPNLVQETPALSVDKVVSDPVIGAGGSFIWPVTFKLDKKTATGGRIVQEAIQIFEFYKGNEDVTEKVLGKGAGKKQFYEAWEVKPMATSPASGFPDDATRTAWSGFAKTLAVRTINAGLPDEASVKAAKDAAKDIDDGKWNSARDIFAVIWPADKPDPTT